MAIEAGVTYINQMVEANPAGAADRSEADDHLRMIKSAVKATFPNITGPMTVTQAALNLNAGNTKTLTTVLSKFSLSIIAINTRVDTLSASVSLVQVDVARISTTVANLWTAHNATSNSVSVVQAALASVSAVLVSSLDSVSVAVYASLRSVSAVIQTSINAVSNTVSVMNARIVSISAVNTQYSLSISAIKTSVAAIGLGGPDQVWVNAKASRTAGVLYQNLAGKPIMVSMAAVGELGASIEISLTVAGVLLAGGYSPAVAGNNSKVVLCGVIPNNASYIVSVVSGSIVSIPVWAELK